MRYTEEQRIGYVRAWEQTELSRKQFSISQSISYASFLSWTKEYSVDAKATFIKLEDRSNYGSKIILPNGVIIETEQSISGNLLKMLLDV